MARWIPTFALFGLAVMAWQMWDNSGTAPDLRETLGLPMPEGVQVTGGFALCDAPGYTQNCTVDGDTFRIGDRRIRIEGIDAAERDGQCQAEKDAATRATAALNDWLDDGPFQMLAEDDAVRDVYARELQTVWREGADGSRDDLADHMIATGHAEVYRRGSRPNWCR